MQKYNSEYHLHLTDNQTACLQKEDSFLELLENKISLSSEQPPCSSPDSHIYWDTLHPTESFHYVLGQLIIAKLNELIH
jgi:phospholipase/lecithinase/hemolysin